MRNSKRFILISKFRVGLEFVIETAGTVSPDSIYCDLASISPKMSNSTPDERAIKFIMENAEDPNTAIANLKIAEDKGEIGSLAELTKARGIFNVESAAQKGSKLQGKLDDITQQRGEQIIEEVGQPFGEGGDAAKIASERKTQLQEPIAPLKQKMIDNANLQ